MKKIFTILFCLGLFTVSFAQRGGKQTRGNNRENQVTQSSGNNQYDAGNQRSSWSDGSYKQGGQRSNSYDGNRNGDRHEGGYGYQRETYGERDRHEGYQSRSYNRRNRNEHENRYRRHRGFLWFR